jgi:hypothetical protein
MVEFGNLHERSGMIVLSHPLEPWWDGVLDRAPPHADVRDDFTFH